MPVGEAPFAAEDVVYTGRFVKIAMNVATHADDARNVLPDVLRSWFGPDAGQLGTAQYVELVPGQSHWQMRPTSAPTTTGGDAEESAM